MGLTKHVLIIAFVALAGTACATGTEGTPDALPGQPDAGGPSGPDASSCPDGCDEDADGVPDGTDQCPETPADEPVNQVGCADSQLTPTLEPDFPPFGLTWVNTGNLGRAGGLTWTYTAIQRKDLFRIYWIPCDEPETPCGISLDGPIDDPAEHWQFSADASDLPNGTLVYTNAPHILLEGGTSQPLSGRLTITIVDQSDAPVPVADVTTLAVPARTGEAGAEITGTYFRVNMLAEVHDTTTATWTPYLDYYDAAPTPEAGDTSYMSISGSFYSK